MATGLFPEDMPGYWQEQDRIEREYDEAVKRGDIKVQWWEHLVEFIIIAPILIIISLSVAIDDAVRKVKKLPRR